MSAPRPSSAQAALALRARGLGCRPVWHDGILGWTFHCTCPGNPHGVDQQCSAITEESIAVAAPLPFATTSRDGGARCDPLAYLDIFGWEGSGAPKGVTSVDTTFAEPGPLEPQGCPLHGFGCPSHCPVLRTARDWGTHLARKTFGEGRDDD